MRHEAPEVRDTASRLGLNGTKAQVFKTLHAGHMGKVSLARVWAGDLADGSEFDQGRVSGVYQILGQKFDKTDAAHEGDVVALGRLDGLSTGDSLGGDGPDWPQPLKPLYSMAIEMDGNADEVKLTSAMQKLCEEDPSLRLEHDLTTGELVLWGQGEMHLRIAGGGGPHRRRPCRWSRRAGQAPAGAL